MMVEVSAHARVPLLEAWRWWTDFGREGDETVLDHGMGKSIRVVREHEGNRWVLDEHLWLPNGRGVRLATHEVVLHEEGAWFDERMLKPVRSRSIWAFASEGAGTRVTRRMELPGWMSGWGPDWLSRKSAQRDLDFHVGQMERELLKPREVG